MELWNERKAEKEVALSGQETNRAGAERLAMGTESYKKCLLNSYWIIALDIVPRFCKNKETKTLKGHKLLILWIRAAMWVKKEKKKSRIWKFTYKNLWKYLLSAFTP